MKILIRVFSIILTSIISLQVIGSVSATEFENYDTISVSKEEQALFFETLKIELMTMEEEVFSFDRFAISNQGLVALGFNASDDAIIYVFNTDGQFLYGYRFLNKHSAFAIFFEGEDLSIYWGKERYIGSFDAEGNCLQFRKVANTAHNSDSYHSDRYRASSGKVGKIQYYAERSIGLSTSYTRFIVEDSENERTVIYDVTGEYNAQSIVCCIFIGSLVSGIIVIFFKNRKPEDDA